MSQEYEAKIYVNYDNLFLKIKVLNMRSWDVQENVP